MASFERSEELARESRRWGGLSKDHFEIANWLNSPTITRHVNQVVSGSQELTWFDWVRQKYLPPESCGGRGLCLGSNHGLFERQIVAAGICSGFDSFDISEESVAIAQAAADKAGMDIRCHVADVNQLELPERRYSLVVVAMALHHFDCLEHVLTQVHHSLAPAGIFTFNEYVGPNHFQFTDLQLEHIKRLRGSLPASLLLGPTGEPVPPTYRPDLEECLRSEPFEAVRSSDILPLTHSIFRVIEQRDYGGTLLHWLFHEIIANFDETQPEHVERIRAACEYERDLIERGLLPSDFTVVVAGRKHGS